MSAPSHSGGGKPDQVLPKSQTLPAQSGPTKYGYATDFPPLQPSSVSPQQVAAASDPSLSQEQPALQTNATTGIDLIYKLLAKSKLDEIIPKGGPTAPSSADDAATPAGNEDFLRVLEKMLKDNESDQGDHRLDEHQEGALRTAVDGIREIRLLLCIGDYTQNVCKGIQAAHNRGKERAKRWRVN
ncbi:hypothetical protein BJY00DRAFT_274864 [Aspergillus carlsbadensis]|nr:hypothetical protein BJY00DRAFT_274864 [Aspergillus carlsbadensis]